MSGIFQAYLAHRDTSFCCVLAFTNSHVADEWWRHVSTHVEFVEFDLKRASPQYYTFTTRARHRNSSRLSVNWPVIPTPQEFSERMSIATIYQGSPATHTPAIAMISSQNVPNRISGAWFYIRSKAPADVCYWDVRAITRYSNEVPGYWYTTRTGNLAYNIVGTRFVNTLFRVVARDLPMGDVLVGTDIVTLQIENPSVKRQELLDIVVIDVEEAIADSSGVESELERDSYDSDREADDAFVTDSGPLTTGSGQPALEFKFADIEAGNFIFDPERGAIVHVADDADVTRGIAHHGWELVGL
ncbi:hypothetical protein CYLTODRAFT_486491 [Cylindrobasidium torrendii FP15055 ss-10]|uniref:Uncharacterized protein n=1 Tax=Cylindrobasidium torrendii FP15055 ss-10 TaxID=1314674 RepID=A0A0D7BPD7_9AGAR|nr:hypothetical protein CYLTODRAFT_486491 [Cylindrobasidium torrendii FP15055 ss-10]